MGGAVCQSSNLERGERGNEGMGKREEEEI
jgi:hypothetical protein